MFNIVLVEAQNIIIERKMSKAHLYYANAEFTSAVGSCDLSHKGNLNYV